MVSGHKLTMNELKGLSNEFRQEYIKTLLYEDKEIQEYVDKKQEQCINEIDN